MQGYTLFLYLSSNIKQTKGLEVNTEAASNGTCMNTQYQLRSTLIPNVILHCSVKVNDQ